MPGGDVEYNSEPFGDRVVFMRPAEVDADVRKMAQNFFDREVLDWLAAMLGRPVKELKFDSHEALILGRTTDVDTLAQMQIAQFYDFVFTIDDTIHRLRALHRMVEQSSKFPSTHVQDMLDANVIGSGFVPHHLTDICRGNRAQPRCRFGNAAWKNFAGGGPFRVFNDTPLMDGMVRGDNEAMEAEVTLQRKQHLVALTTNRVAAQDAPEAVARIPELVGDRMDQLSPFTISESAWTSAEDDVRTLKWNQMVATQEAALLAYPLLNAILALNQGLFRVHLTRARYNLMPGRSGSGDTAVIPRGTWVNAFASGAPPINLARSMDGVRGANSTDAPLEWMSTFIGVDGKPPRDYEVAAVRGPDDKDQPTTTDVVRGVLQPKITKPDMYVLMGDPMAYPKSIRRAVTQSLAGKLGDGRSGGAEEVRDDMRLAAHRHLQEIHKHNGQGGAIGSVILNGTSVLGVAAVAGGQVIIKQDVQTRMLGAVFGGSTSRERVEDLWLMDKPMEPHQASSASRTAAVQHVPWGSIEEAMKRLGAQGHPIAASPRLREVFDMSNIGRLLLVFYNRIAAAYTKERETSMVGRSIATMDDIAGLRSKATVGYEMACPDGMAPRFVEVRNGQRVPISLEGATFLHSDGKRYMKPGAIRDGCEPLRPAPLLSGGLRPNVLLEPLVGPGGTPLMGGVDPATRDLLKEQAGDGSIVPDIYAAKNDTAATELGVSLFAARSGDPAPGGDAAVAAHSLLMGAN